MPVCIEGELRECQAPFLTDVGANVPGLWGLRSQRAMRTLIDAGGNCGFMPGPGGFEIKLSPGSRVVRCEDAVSGHMMVPVSDLESRIMRSETKWILYGTLGDKDKPRSPRSRTPEMPRCRPFAKRCEHLYHSRPCGNTCRLKKKH